MSASSDSFGRSRWNRSLFETVEQGKSPTVSPLFAAQSRPSFEETKTYKKYHGFMLDDGSDTVPCVSWYSNICENDHHQVELGQFVQVDGQLQWKNGKVIICVSRFAVQNDPHAELFWWMKLAHIHSRVYNQAFPIVGRIK